jgi:NTP pyrophosphatase (non-canonical NTP hydrolase)
VSTVSKWVPTQDLMTLRRLGKTGEELGELVAVVNRCVIQGIDEVDPGTGKTNRLRLEEDIADVSAQLMCTVQAFDLDGLAINARMLRKIGYMNEWEAMFKEPA